MKWLHSPDGETIVGTPAPLPASLITKRGTVTNPNRLLEKDLNNYGYFRVDESKPQYNDLWEDCLNAGMYIEDKIVKINWKVVLRTRDEIISNKSTLIASHYDDLINEGFAWRGLHWTMQQSAQAEYDKLAVQSLLGVDNLKLIHVSGQDFGFKASDYQEFYRAIYQWYNDILEKQRRRIAEITGMEKVEDIINAPLGES